MDHSYLFIDTADDARRALATWLDVRLVGLDTETYFDPQTRRMRLSLIQLARADAPVIVIDARAVESEHWRAIVEAEEVGMVAHNARFDQKVLLDHGLTPRGLVDTLHLARRALHLGSYTLSAVAEELFGTPLDKSLQKSDWRIRPLTAEQLAYAAADARLSLLIFQELRRRLEAAGRFDEVLRGARLDDGQVGAAPKQRRRGASSQPAPLSRNDKAIYQNLKRWRLEYARTNHLPAYMICPDKTLEHLAQAKPTTIEALSSIVGLGEAKIKRFGAELLAALAQAIAANAR